MWNKHVRMALLGAGLLALAACQKMTMENGTPALRQGMYTLTVEATKGADTKSLDLSGSSLNAAWENGETVAVYLGGQVSGRSHRNGFRRFLPYGQPVGNAEFCNWHRRKCRSHPAFPER